MSSLAQDLSGPCLLKHRGQVFHFRNGLKLTPLSNPFAVTSDVHGVIGQRNGPNSFILEGTPIGVWSTAQLAVLYRTALLSIGSLLTPRYDVSGVNATTNVWTLLGSSEPRAGCPVRVVAFAGGVVPGGITSTTTYYWGATNNKLYDTEAHAITDDGTTGLIDITDTGTDDFSLIEQEYIQVDCLTVNRRITFHNAAVLTPPPVALGSQATPLGAVQFACFPKEGIAISTANSTYTAAKQALTDTAPDPTAIPTQSYSCAFGAAPFDSFKTRGQVSLTPTLGVENIETDDGGVIGALVKDRGVSAKLTPVGLSQAQMLDLLLMQGTGASRGATKVRADLVITGTGVVCTIYNGAPRTLPQTFQAGPLAGELEIVGAGNTTPGSAHFAFGTA